MAFKLFFFVSRLENERIKIRSLKIIFIIYYYLFSFFIAPILYFIIYLQQMSQYVHQWIYYSIHICCDPMGQFFVVLMIHEASRTWPFQSLLIKKNLPFFWQRWGSNSYRRIRSRAFYHCANQLLLKVLLFYENIYLIFSLKRPI